MGTFKDLTVYKKSFELAVEIYNISKKFPAEEMYGLTSQIRRSSRSVSVNLAEGYRKRLYEAHFVSKSSDADMENTETQVWLDFALAFDFVNDKKHTDLTAKSQEIGKMINHMILNPKKYIGNIKSK
jgi:four helix bundle protein